VEKKLEEKQRDEQFQLRREKAALWNERREKQRELRQLETKMKLVRAVGSSSYLSPYCNSQTRRSNNLML